METFTCKDCGIVFGTSERYKGRHVCKTCDRKRSSEYRNTYKADNENKTDEQLYDSSIKTCSTCFRQLSRLSIHWNKDLYMKDGLSMDCKVCHIYSNLKKTMKKEGYNIVLTSQEFLKWYFEQPQDKCPLCENIFDEDNSKYQKHVDHTHDVNLTVNSLRGLICVNCNIRYVSTIDFMLVNPTYYKKVLEYCSKERRIGK